VTVRMRRASPRGGGIRQESSEDREETGASSPTSGGDDFHWGNRSNPDPNFQLEACLDREVLECILFQSMSWRGFIHFFKLQSQFGREYTSTLSYSNKAFIGFQKPMQTTLGRLPPGLSFLGLEQNPRGDRCTKGGLNVSDFESHDEGTPCWTQRLLKKGITLFIQICSSLLLT
jgi:hypothetical protein